VYIDGWGFPTELNVSCCYFLDLFSLSVGEFLEINVSKNISLFLIVVIIIKSHNYIFLAKMQTLLLVPKLQNFFQLTSPFVLLSLIENIKYIIKWQQPPLLPSKSMLVIFLSS